MPPFSWVQVDDPVENVEISWDLNNKQAHVIKLPPLEERHGCWASDSGNMRMNYGPLHPPALKGGSKAGGAATAGIGQTSRPVLPTSVRQGISKPVIEDLGVETIKGIEAHGRRVTMTIPAGQIGNDQPLVTTTETWRSPALGIEVRRTSDSPQSGKSTMELVSLDRSDPPITTFQPPEGYEVTTEELHQVTCAGEGRP